MNGYYIHKEPVLDRKNGVFGHKLFFRKANSRESGWPAVAADRELIEAVSYGGGFEKLTGTKPAFIDIDPIAVEADSLKALPKGSVLQIPSKDGLDKDVLIKSAVLKKNAYQIAVVHDPSGLSALPLHQIADFVEVDLLSFDPDRLASDATLFQKLPGKLMAVNVPDRETLDHCQKMGFELFQGLFFIQPAAGSESISSSQSLLMQLSSDLRANKDLALIEKAFKNSPKLTFGLLKLINSAFFGVAQKVTSIRHAITLLGYENLQKWVVLLLFTVDRRDEQVNPLIERAIVRGRVMETLAKLAGEKAVVDSAFITGMLSMINVLFNVSSTEVTEKMNLAQEIQDALVAREGLLGRLLGLAEKMDRQEYDAMNEELDRLFLSAADVLDAETNAIMECHTVFGAGQP